MPFAAWLFQVQGAQGQFTDSLKNCSFLRGMYEVAL